MKIMSFNVGIWSRNRRKSDPFYWKPRMKSMTRMILDQDPDVICFQELWFPATLYVPKSYHKVPFTGPEHPIYVRKGIHSSWGLFSIHWSYAKVNDIRIFSIHGHWDDKKTSRLCQNVRKIYAKDDTPAVLIGDWNVSYDDNLISKTQLLHSTRSHLNLPPKDTYLHFYDNNRRGEIDLALVYNLQPLSYTVIENDYDSPNNRLSDHYPIMITI